MQASEAEETASWRHNRLNHEQFLLRQMENGKTISPLFEAPHADKKVIRRDWLHNCDHGVGQDFAGNVLKVFAGKMHAPNHKESVLLLWDYIQDWYVRKGERDKMAQLTPGAIQQPKKGPKLNASAACVRAVYPFMRDASLLLLDATDPKEQAIQVACEELNKCKECLAGDADMLWEDILRDSSKKLLCNARLYG